MKGATMLKYRTKIDLKSSALYGNKLADLDTITLKNNKTRRQTGSK